MNERQRPGAPPPGAAARNLRVVGSDAYADWDEIYTDNVVWIYRVLFSKVGNRADAEDLTTEVFLAALGPLRTTASRPEVRAYLAATARTTLAGYWRRRLGLEITSIDPDVAVRERDDPRPRRAPPPRPASCWPPSPSGTAACSSCASWSRSRSGRRPTSSASAWPTPRCSSTGVAHGGEGTAATAPAAAAARRSIVRRRKRGDQFADALANGEPIPSGRLDDPEDADALRAAIGLRAGQAAADLPSEEFVARLRQELATEAGGGRGGITDERRLSRRILLGSAGAVAAGAAGIALDRSVLGGGTISPAASASKGGPLDPVDGEWLAVASDAELSGGAPRRFATASVVGFVTATQDGPVAVSGACTHLGCLLQQNDAAGRLDCPCHRTAFSHDGRILPRLQLRRRDGNVEVLVPRQA